MSSDTAVLSRAKGRTAPRFRPRSLNKPSSKDKGMNEIQAIALSLGRDVFCVLDARLNCLSLSDNWSRVSGFAQFEGLDEGLKSRIAPDHIRKIVQYLSLGSTRVNPVRFQVKDKAKQWRWFELQYVEETGEQFQCLLRDVTDIVITQGKLEKAKLEADLANKSRSEFLANMSHELRTPLNAILGFAQMMENGTYGEIGHPKYHDYMGSIQKSGHTLLSKINDLLEIANIDSGKMALNEADIDLVEVLRQAVEFHSHHAFAEQISLRAHLPNEPLMVNADRIRLLQVVTNLLSNAIKYNRQGGLVDLGCTIHKDGGINIVIQDNGGGIPSSQLQNILAAFRQDNSFFARSRDCMGLGLALSKEIVKLHQGRIDIESEMGVGTLLTIHLPKVRTVSKNAAKILESVEA